MENRFVITLTAVMLWVIQELCAIVWPPLDFPQNIPTIPFYVNLIGLFKDLDQEQIYNRYYRAKLEKYGAVKVYFGSRWNVLVSRPEYLSQILRFNDIFEKSGNQEKIPHSVLAEYTGDNVISAGNSNWKLYRKVVTESILFPNLEPLHHNTKDFALSLAKQLQTSELINIGLSLQKLTMANIGDCILGVDLHCSSSGGAQIFRQLQRVKAQIFRPLYMSFPALDSFPIRSRLEARKAVQNFKKRYCQKIVDEVTPENSNRLGPKLASSFEMGEITEKQFQDNAIIVLVAGHENPQLLFTSLLYVLAKHPDQQKLLREQLKSTSSKEELPLLHSIIYETLRMYPPIGQIINRKTNCKVQLGADIVIPKDTYVGYNNFATQRDPNYWGQDCDSFNPNRWGSTLKEINETYNLAKSRCTLPAFHGRSRACLGEKFALAQTKRFLVAVAENFHIELDPNWNERLTPAGPISPRNLSLVIREVCQTSSSEWIAIA